MMKIKTTPFDASKHVLQGRDGEDGREAFFTLGDIVAAERPLEAQHEAGEIARLEAKIDALQSAPAVPENIVALIRENSPPAELTQETMAVLTEIAKAQVADRRDLSELARKVEVLAQTLLKISERIQV